MRQGQFYPNDGDSRFKLNFFIQALVFLALFIIVEPLDLALRIVGLSVLVIPTLTYLFICLMTWDVTTFDDKIVFSNRYKLFGKKKYEFKLSKIKELECALHAKGGSALRLTSFDGDTNSFQAVTEEAALAIGKFFKSKGVKVIIMHNIFNKEEL